MISCPQCGATEWEKRGSRRCYFVIDPTTLETLTWNEADADWIEMDVDGDEEVLYCGVCDSAFTEPELRKAQS